ncbi:hypothetical protein [Burkholderia stagnalis]|uniref:Uncharacterized protein n=1 Tax=Burkholderia stagnalis TaxID=1503054 RepID=A0A6L3N0U6_9BURK|nr:hypothetical protein [Burkholderia stagnalis]KAB0639541.1 hypothetical protein F7R25_07970 [Burkholderia stagnalis]VWB52130.1 hypothetical protein BST28156_02422 [Burkholderia stagnalis]
MAEPTTETTLAPFELYLAYDYLPARQYGQILTTLDELYQSLTRSQFDELNFPWYLRRPFAASPIAPPLCIERVETGQSIKCRFAGVGESGKLKWENWDLEFVIPVFMAPLVALAGIIAGGVWVCDHYLDLRVKQSQIDLNHAQAEVAKQQAYMNAAQTEQARSQAELNHALAADALRHAEVNAAQAEETRLRTHHLMQQHVERHEPPKSEPARSVHFEVQAQVQNFYALINQPNITRSTVNGFDVRAPSDTDDLR